MNEPIEIAYQALAIKLADALFAAAFIPSAEALRIDPPSTFAPSGEEERLVTAAALLMLQTQAVRVLLGAPGARYVVERTCRLELAAAGPDQPTWLAALGAALTAVAPIAVTDPTLGGATERVEIDLEEDDDLPPDGNKMFVNFTLRVRSGDPLGRTP